MRQRNVKNQDEILSSFDRYVQNPESLKGKWHGGFKEVHLEIGIGKGQFIYELAKKNPDILYVGIELNKGVISLASKKILRKEQEEAIHVANLKLFSFDAADLDKVFTEGEVDKIYLNFSDPWPKKKHAKRRLTSKTFLDKYRLILKKDGIIEQKTDNMGLFEFSILSFNENNLLMEDISLNVYADIANGKILDNIPTEYEEKFRDKGPIYKMIAKFRSDV
ncbi:MAG: tRNA (guanosine(46)-N7)-methyltransferase TrmB [Clostridia bacterium]|nr:tRNA (guanosine(46)-N7)-methyltransferase TrmB [Clostridia bacterium]